MAWTVFWSKLEPWLLYRVEVSAIGGWSDPDPKMDDDDMTVLRSRSVKTIKTQGLDCVEVQARTMDCVDVPASGRYDRGDVIVAGVFNDGKVMEYWTACVPEQGLSAQMQGNEEMMK